MRLAIENSFSSCLRDAGCFKNENNRGSTSVLSNVPWQKLEATSCPLLVCVTVLEALNFSHITLEIYMKKCPVLRPIKKIRDRDRRKSVSRDC